MHRGVVIQMEVSIYMGFGHSFKLWGGKKQVNLLNYEHEKVMSHLRLWLIRNPHTALNFPHAINGYKLTFFQA